ncbi:MAG: type IV secretory system conjugative DNA transfer family protein, partial [Microvirga sp.]
KVVQKNARTAGIQAGYAEESIRIADYLTSPGIGQRLDARYPFEQVFIDGRIVPPVVSELRDVKEALDRRTIRTSLGSFEIIRPAHVAVAPPSWRDYLIIPPPPSRATTWTPPKGAEEQANWDVGYKAGLAIGIEQARAAFDDNLNRLERDLTGMRRYHELAAQGAVSLPIVRTKTVASRVSRDGHSATVGEQVIDLVVSPKFRQSASHEEPSARRARARYRREAVGGPTARAEAGTAATKPEVPPAAPSSRLTDLNISPPIRRSAVRNGG